MGEAFDTDIGRPIFWGTPYWYDGAGNQQPVFFDGSIAPSPFDFTAWSPGGVTVTKNAAVGPDGTMNACQVLSDTSTGGHTVGQFTVSRSAAPGNYRISCWVKPIGGYDFGLVIDDGTVNNRLTQLFTLSTGAIGALTTTGAGLVSAQAYISAAVNGFYQCTFDVSLTAAITTLRVGLRLASSGSVSFAGATSGGVFAWGGQAVALATPATGKLFAVPNILMSSDMHTDVDDFVGLRFLANAMNAGSCNLIACVVDGSDPTGAPAMRAMLNYSGLSSVPVGAYKGGDQPVSASSPCIPVTNSFRPGDTLANYPDAIATMRQALAASADLSVTCMAMGGLSTWYYLLISPADAYSPLTGAQLVARKVRRLVLEAGDYLTGAEHNFQITPSYSAYVAANWPTEIVGIGYNLGAAVSSAINPAESTSTSPYALGYSNAPSGYLTTVTGVTSLALGAAGSGGTPGTYALAFSGGGGDGGPAGTFTVGAGGAIASYKLKAGGGGYTSAPSVSTAACPGLTGASITASTGSYGVRASWGAIAAYVSINGIDTNLFCAAGPSKIQVDATTGNNTTPLTPPGLGNATYVAKTISQAAFGSLIDQGVW